MGDATLAGSYDLVVVAATPLELEWATKKSSEEPFSAKPLWGRAEIEGLRVCLLSTGSGPVNAALSLGALGAQVNALLILNCGVAGAYPGCSLGVGELAVASAEIDADTGVEPVSPDGALSPLSIPLHDHDELTYGCYPTDPQLTEIMMVAASVVGRAKHGPFVTSATVTATIERAERLQRLHGALCENMEGAALARGALELGMKFVAVRGISNIAGPRDLSSWELSEAAKASGEAAALFIKRYAAIAG